MKIYTYTEDINYKYNGISDNPKDILYFDIETTGLCADSSTLYMIGYGFYAEWAYNTVLLFNDDGESELEMLCSFMKTLAGYKYLVSYNGDTFDIPYLKAKLNNHEIKSCFDNIQSVDIYKITRRYKKLFKLQSAKQIDVEMLVGFRRKSFISGGDLIKAYKSYISDNSSRLLNNMLTHNHDDIRGLISVSEFENITHISENFTIKKIQNNAENIVFYCDTIKLPCRIMHSEGDLIVNGNDNELTIRIRKICASMKHYFKDYKNYYYLPLENMSIHKSMACFVDKDHIEKATKETAFVAKSSEYIYSPKGYNGTLFRKNNSTDPPYIEVNDDIPGNMKCCNLYVKCILQSIFDY